MAVKNPHLELIFATVRHAVRCLACTIQRWAFLDGLHDFGHVVAARHLEHFAQLPPAQILALPGVATVMNVVATRRVGEEVPRVDPLGRWGDAADGDVFRQPHFVLTHHLAVLALGERAFEHARPNAGRILDEAAHLTMPARFDQAVVNLGLHGLGGDRSNGYRLLHRLFRGIWPTDLCDLCVIHAREWGWLQSPRPVIRWQEHVRNPRTPCINVGPGDVQEHHRSCRAAFEGLPGGPAFRHRHVGRVLKSTVGIVNALVVLFILLPLHFDARPQTPGDGFFSLGKQALQEPVPQRCGFFLLCFVVFWLHVSIQFLGQAAATRRHAGFRLGAPWPCASSSARTGCKTSSHPWP